MGYVLRDLPSLDGAFAEIHRVLQPGGRTGILEIGPPRNALVRAAWAAHIRGVLPVLARAFACDREAPRLVQSLWDTLDASPKPGAVIRAVEDCGFASAEHLRDLGISSAYLAEKPAG